MKYNTIRTFVAASVAALSLSAAAEINLWQVFPALPEQPKADMRFRAMMPQGQALVQMADNEYESLVVGVENRSDAMLDFSVDAADLAAKIPGMSVEVRASWDVPIGMFPANGKAAQTMGATSYGAVGTTGDPFLPCPGDRVLGCPVYENRSVWVTLHAKGVKAGSYTADVKVTTPDGVKTLPVTVEVWPFRLADKLKAICYHWDYSTSPAAIRDEVEHGVNTFMMPFDMAGSLKLAKDGTFTAKFKLEAVKAKLAVVPDAYFIGSYGFFGEFCEWAQRNKVKYMSDDFKAYFKQAIRALVRDLKEIGLGYDRYWLQHWDEANGGSAKKVLEMGPVAKEADPNVRWFFDHMSSWGEITGLAPYSQMMGPRGEASWAVSQAKFYNETFRAMHKDAKLIQFKQTGIYRGNGAVNHYNRYRSWRTWLNHWDGFCTFAHAYSVYFWNSDHPTSVRQWEVSREGYEDYKYFELYLDLAEKAGRRDEAVKFLDKLVQDILGPTGPGTRQLYDQEGTWCQYYPYWARQQLAKKIAALAGRSLAEPTAYEPQTYAYALPADAKEVVLENCDADIAGAKFEPVNIDLKFQLLNNRYTLFPLQFAIDDYVLSLADVLTPGEEYELIGSYKCPADKVPQPRLIISGIDEKANPFTVRDGKSHDFSVRFRVPEGVKDLNVVFKEIRNMTGETIENRCDLQNVVLKRHSEGGKALPKAAPAPQLPPKSFAKGLKGEYQVRGAKVVKGRHYVFAVEYSSDHAIAEGVKVMAAKKHGAYPHVYGTVNLKPTDGKAETAYRPFVAVQDEDIIAMIGRNAEIEYNDERGVRHPAKLSVKSIRLYEVTDPDGVARNKALRKQWDSVPKQMKAVEPSLVKDLVLKHGNVTVWKAEKDGKRYLTILGYRPERTVGFLMMDKDAKPYGWRPIAIPAMTLKTFEAPAGEKTTTLLSITKDCPDVTVEW